MDFGRIFLACSWFLLLAPPARAVDLSFWTTNVTMPAGRTFQMPLTGSDPMGSPLAFSIDSISDARLSGLLAPESNRSLRLHVSGVDAGSAPFAGDLVLQLYEDLAPLTTARLIALTANHFYDGLTFHRVIQDFMGQGGDPSGNGTGGSGVKFDDEFVASLTFTGFGQFAMANSGDDSNDSQFFITDVDLSVGDPSRLPPRHLDFNHTIFGQMTKGFDVFTKLMGTPTGDNDRPLTPVVIQSAEVFDDSQDAVLRLAAQAGFTGEADVTVRATNTNGAFATQTIHVTVVSNTVNSAAFLGPVPSDLVTTQNTALVFALTPTDIDGDPISLEVLDASTGQFPLQLTNAFFDANTSRLTIVPAKNFTGNVPLILGAKDSTHPYDTQRCTLTVSPCGYTLGTTNDLFPSSGGIGSVGPAPVHRDPPGVAVKLRKIQCISQPTWNLLRCWVRSTLSSRKRASARATRETAAPAPRGGEGGRGRRRGRSAPPKIVGQRVSPPVKPRDAKPKPSRAVQRTTLLRRDPI